MKRINRTYLIKLLITGHTGVLGSEILKLAEMNKDITVTRFDGDLSSRKSICNFFERHPSHSHVIHSAGLVPVSKSSVDPLSTYKINAIGTGTLFSEVLRLNPNIHVIYISSSHVYKPIKQGFLTEDSELAPQSVYGRSKLTAEYLALDVMQNSPKQLGILRLFSLFSEKQKEDYLLPTIKRKLLKHKDGDFFPLNGWNNIRDFSSSELHAKKILKLTLKNFYGIINVGSGIGKTVGQFAQEVARKKLDFSDQSASQNPNCFVADQSIAARWGITNDF